MRICPQCNRQMDSIQPIIYRFDKHVSLHGITICICICGEQLVSIPKISKLREMIKQNNNAKQFKYNGNDWEIVL